MVEGLNLTTAGSPEILEKSQGNLRKPQEPPQEPRQEGRGVFYLDSPSLNVALRDVGFTFFFMGICKTPIY